MVAEPTYCEVPASKTYTKVPLTGLPPLVLTMPDRLTTGGATRVMSWVVAPLTVIAVALPMLEPPNHWSG